MHRFRTRSTHSTRTRTRTRTRTATLATLIGTVGFAFLLALAPTGATSPASAAAAIDQCNGILNASAQQVECQVVIENTLDLDSATQSSVVTVTQCIGAPAAVICGPSVSTASSELTTSVTQCNGSINAGGSVLICAVQIVNTITGSAQTTPATVNQCVGSGEGGGESTLLCDSYASTSGATVTQCNGSANNGGAPERVICSVGPSTQTAAIPVTVNQCNGSAAGGGDIVRCTVQLINRGDRVTYTGPDLTTTVPITFPAAGGLVVAPDVSEANNPVLVPVPEAGTPGTPVSPGTPANPGTPAALAETGLDVRLPLLAGALALTIGGGFSFVALMRRREKKLER
jgi:hypothetical protein